MCKGGITNQGDVHVNGAGVQEPMHECALGWHHVGVFLRVLRHLLLGGKGRPRIAWGISGQPRSVRRRVESSGFLKNFGLGGIRG